MDFVALNVRMKLMSTLRGRLFYRLVQQAVDVEPLEQNRIINHQLDRKE